MMAVTARSNKNRIELQGKIFEKDSFVSVTFLEGEGKINSLPYKKFDSFFIPCKEDCIIEGEGAYILTKVEKYE